MILLKVLPLAVFLSAASAVTKTEAELKQFLENEYEKEASELCFRSNDAEWKYATDMTDANEQNLVDVTLSNSKRNKEIYEVWFKDVKLEDIKDESVKRQLKMLKNIGKSALDEADLKKFTDIGNKMTNIYSTGKICPYNKKECDLQSEGLTLEPGIEQIISTSKDTKELEYAWTAWRDATGKEIRKYYPEYVTFSNLIAEKNGFKNMGDMWITHYDSETFKKDVDELWKQVEPLYNALHKYVREKLILKYGKQVIGDDGLIPAHLLGNMWGQSWINLAEDVKPYPEASKVDVTAALKSKGYDAQKMFEESNKFYTSMGLKNCDMSYGPGSMIIKPQGKDVLCHASAWDFCDKKTYRIKMCTEVNYEDFITIHHEMGHIQYDLQYQDNPITFRDGANPGFHEAIGDTIALSVSTPKHLKKIGLIDESYQDSKEASINALMNMALERVAFLPFGLLIDKWRWDVFEGTVKENEWNAKWWEYRKQYQKLKPPVERSEKDFDPGAKFHVAGDSQYINYFIAHILEFQIYKGLCIAAGEYKPGDSSKPLHQCDFYNNTEAGKKFSEGLKLGQSKNWREALKAITGEDKIDAAAITEYFKPLKEYLDNASPSVTSSLLMLVINAFIVLFR